MFTPLGQHGAASRADAVKLLGLPTVRSAERSGQLVTPWPGLLVDVSRSASPITLAAAAVELAGPRAYLAGPTAAHLHGCSAADLTPVHLVVPYEHPLRSRGGLVVHNGPTPETDVCVVLGLPALTLERSIADLLCRATPATALAIADQAMAMLEPPDRERFRAAVAKHIVQRPDPRGRVRGHNLLDLVTDRADSPAESRLRFRVIDAGYPVPVVNHVIVDIDGHTLYKLDLAWPELRIALEYHGYAAHIGRELQDAERAEDVRRRGWIYIDVWADEVTPARYEQELDAAFLARGVDMGHRRAGVLQGRRHREPRSSSAR